MDNKIASIVAKLRELTPQRMEVEVLAIIKREENFVADLNTGQLFQGINSDGSKIEPEYTPFTKEIKRGKGQPTDRVTLLDEGNFYKGFFIENTTKFPLSLNSKDSKTTKIVAKYGEKIFDLTEDNEAVLSDHVKESVQDRFKELITSQL